MYGASFAQNTSYGAGAGSGGADNSFFGAAAGAQNTGSLSTFMGKAAGYGNHGNDNVYIGYYSGRANAGGHSNTFVGSRTGFDAKGTRILMMISTS